MTKTVTALGKQMASVTYRANPSLPFIITGWKGNPHNGLRYFDPQYHFEQSFSHVLRWLLTNNPQKTEKKNSTWQLPIITGKKFLQTSDNCMVWLGHASFFIRYNGVQLITDPVFYSLFSVVKRHCRLPCAVDDFTAIDYVLLSHCHRDHCDERSLRELYAHNKFHLVSSLGGAGLVSHWLPKLASTEMGWYQQLRLRENITITHLPTRHWSNRFPWDINQTLWGSYVLELGSTTIFFGGDSGYSDYPKQIAKLFPKIDYAIIGVGAYKPDYMMQHVHTSPQQAVQVVHELSARHFIPMHYGTFDLADEPLHEPARILQQMNEEQRISAKLRLLAIGEILLF